MQYVERKIDYRRAMEGHDEPAARIAGEARELILATLANRD